jgi:CBS domain pair.
MFWRRKKTPEDNRSEKTKESIKKAECSFWEGSRKNQCLLVSDVYKLHECISTSIYADSPVDEVLGSFMHNPSLCGIFLVDSKLQFVGLIMRIDLLRWAHIRIAGGKGRHEIVLSEFYRIADARKAKDLVAPDTQKLSVKEGDTLQIALDKMLDYEQDVIPVLDEEGRILGDLSLSEVLWSGIAYGRKTTRE